MADLDTLQGRAEAIGLTIDEDHVYTDSTNTEIDQPGYWLVYSDTGEGAFEDGNFATSLEELASILRDAESLYP